MDEESILAGLTPAQRERALARLAREREQEEHFDELVSDADAFKRRFADLYERAVDLTEVAPKYEESARFRNHLLDVLEWLRGESDKEPIDWYWIGAND